MKPVKGLLPPTIESSVHVLPSSVETWKNILSKLCRKSLVITTQVRGEVGFTAPATPAFGHGFRSCVTCTFVNLTMAGADAFAARIAACFCASACAPPAGSTEPSRSHGALCSFCTCCTYDSRSAKDFTGPAAVAARAHRSMPAERNAARQKFNIDSFIVASFAFVEEGFAREKKTISIFFVLVARSFRGIIVGE